MEIKKDIFDHLKPKKVIVPDSSYFDQLAANVLEAKKVKIVPLYRKPIFWMSSAAAVIAIIMLINVNSTAQNSATPAIAWNEVSSQELFTYVNDHIDEFDAEMLSDILPSENIEEVELVASDNVEVDEISTENDLNFDSIEQEDILEYILNEEIDIYDIEEFEEIFI